MVGGLQTTRQAGDGREGEGEVTLLQTTTKRWWGKGVSLEPPRAAQVMIVATSPNGASAFFFDQYRFHALAEMCGCVCVCPGVSTVVVGEGGRGAPWRKGGTPCFEKEGINDAKGGGTWVCRVPADGGVDVLSGCTASMPHVL